MTRTSNSQSQVRCQNLLDHDQSAPVPTPPPADTNMGIFMQNATNGEGIYGGVVMVDESVLMGDENFELAESGSLSEFIGSRSVRPSPDTPSRRH